MTSLSTVDAGRAIVPRGTPYPELSHLACELHDTVAHALSGIALAAAGARRAAAGARRAAAVARRAAGDPEGAGADPVPLPLTGEREALLGALRAIEACAVEAMTDLHALLGLMRTGPVRDAGHAGAPERPDERSRRLTDVADLIARADAAGLAVVLNEDGRRRRLAPRAEHLAYRVVQEGLTNAMRYAGLGAAAQVHLAWSADRLVLTVSTFGRTRAPGPGGTGQGLSGLAQRVIALGGRFAAGHDGAGFRIDAVLPTGTREPDVTPRGPHAGSRSGSRSGSPAATGAKSRAGSRSGPLVGAAVGPPGRPAPAGGS